MDCPTILQIDIFHGFSLTVSVPRVYCTGILYIAFPEFSKELARYELITHVFLFLMQFSRKNKFCKDVWLEKVTVSWSETNSETCQTSMMELSIVTYFDKKLHIFWLGSKYASDGDCCSILWGHFQYKKILFSVLTKKHNQQLFLTAWQYFQYKW